MFKGFIDNASVISLSSNLVGKMKKCHFFSLLLIIMLCTNKILMTLSTFVFCLQQITYLLSLSSIVHCYNASVSILLFDLSTIGIIVIPIKLMPIISFRIWFVTESNSIILSHLLTIQVPIRHNFAEAK